MEELISVLITLVSLCIVFIGLVALWLKTIEHRMDILVDKLIYIASKINETKDKE